MSDAERLTDEERRRAAEKFHRDRALSADGEELKRWTGQRVSQVRQKQWNGLLAFAARMMRERDALAAVPPLAARAGDREGEGIAGRVIVWNGVPQNGSFSSNPEAFERTRDGIEGDTFLWPEDSEIVPARLFVDRAAPGGEQNGEQG